MKIYHLTEEVLQAIERLRTGWVHFYYDVNLDEYDTDMGKVYITFEHPKDALKLGWKVKNYE